MIRSVDTEETTPSPQPTPRRSQYKSCPEVYPIKFGCKNETIKKVQACLGLPEKYQTGNFGPITQQSLINKGYDGNSITTEITINVCGQNNPEKPPVTTPPVKPEEIEAPDNTINPENF